MGNFAVKTLIAFLLLASFAVAADRSAELQKALSRRRTFLVIKVADVKAANAAAVSAFGAKDAKMFSVQFTKDKADKPTHYVASIAGMTPDEVAKFQKAFDSLIKSNKITKYDKTSKDILTELKLESKQKVEAVKTP